MLSYSVQILFERIQSNLVVGYEILKNTTKQEQKRIAFIQDTGVNPVLVSKELVLDESNKQTIGNLIFRVPNSNLIVDNEHPFVLYADGREIANDAYILSKDTSTLFYYSISSVLPVLTAGYYIDAITYNVDVTDSFSYTIMPVINEQNNLIGRHTELI